MTELTLPVRVGKAPTSYGQPLEAGTTIYNSDTQQAVWVSANASVQPGVGIRLGPLASLEWQGGTPYFVTDNSSTPVTLYITNAVSGFSDPEAVAIQTATQLLANGVPSVLLNKLLVLRTQITNNPIVYNEFIDISVSEFASLTLLSSGTTDNARQLFKIDFHQDSTVGGPFDTFPYTQYLTNVDVNAEMAFAIPLNCGSVRITNLTPDGQPRTIGSVNLIVWGSNRPVSKITALHDSFTPRLLSYNGAIAANSSVQLAAADGLANSCCFNGPVQFNMQVGNSPGTLTLECGYLGPDGNFHNLIQGTFNGNSNLTNITVPAVPFFVSIFTPVAASSSFAISCWVTPVNQ